MKSRRIDAINTLIQLQMEQEKYRARNPEYAADLSLLPVRKDGDVYLSVEGDYLIELLESSSTRFGISAVAVTGGRQEKDICQNYIIDENGPVIQGDVQRRCWNL